MFLVNMLQMSLRKNGCTDVRFTVLHKQSGTSTSGAVIYVVLLVFGKTSGSQRDVIFSIFCPKRGGRGGGGGLRGLSQ
jgi:hypothetical protein